MHILLILLLFLLSLPENASVLDVCIGDLGNDGTQDIAVVVQTPTSAVSVFTDDQYEYLSRSLYIFTETSTNCFVCTQQNNDIILSNNDGGMYGDPYAGIVITDGKLIVSDYGGSSDRWGNDYIFEQTGQELLLTEIQNLSMSTHTGNGTLETYDLTEGTVRKEAISTWNEEFKPLLLYSGTFEPQTIPFEEAKAFQQTSLSPTPSYPMPSLSYYEYSEEPKELHYSPEEVLDKIQAEYYPEMERIDIPCDAQILENYSLLLGYQVPRYYYSDGNAVLYYFILDYNFTSHPSSHKVIYISDERRFYHIYDDDTEAQIHSY